MATDCLTMLGLRPGASRTEILAAFRAKSKDCHPDQGGNPEEFRRLLAAKNAALSALEYAEFFTETHSQDIQHRSTTSEHRVQGAERQ